MIRGRAAGSMRMYWENNIVGEYRCNCVKIGVYLTRIGVKRTFS